MKTTVGVILLVVVVGGVVYLNDALRNERGESLLRVAREIELEVETAHPLRRDIVRLVQAPGEVEALAEVDISSEVVAKILELPVEEGDAVSAGDLLCRLDDVDYRARVLSGQANVAKLKALIDQAQADLEKADRDYERQKRLIETYATSPTELANYKTLFVGARATLEVRKQELIEAEASLAAAREDLSKTVITSPIDGVVSQLFAEKGEVVITGTMNNPGTRIMVVSDMSVMQVRCRVDETDAPLTAVDQSARIYLQSDTRRSIPGKVLRVGIKGTRPAGRDVVTFETLILITKDDPRVKSGMTANVEIEVAKHSEALTIPVEAVVYRKRRDLPAQLLEQDDAKPGTRADGANQRQAEYLKLVFCVDDGRARPCLVQTGISDARSVEITSGITDANQVVIGPYRSLDQLKDGARVKITAPAVEQSQPADDDIVSDRDAAGTPIAASGAPSESSSGDEPGE